MSTFAELETIVRSRIPNGQSIVFSFDSLLREAENDYCERTWCLEKIDVVDTTTVGGGVISPTYAFPVNSSNESEFLREFRIEWNGTPLVKAHIKDKSLTVYDGANNYETGEPEQYLITNGLLRLNPMPSGHGYIGRWYAIKNTDVDSVSPAIPELEHRNLVNYALFTWYEIDEKFDKAQYFKQQYLTACSAAYVRYKNRRGKQTRLVDPAYLGWRSRSGNIVQEATTGAATVFRETMERASGVNSVSAPAVVDPYELYQAGDNIVHTSVLATFTSVPVVVFISKSAWPIYLESVAVVNGHAVINIGLGDGGQATTLDYTLGII